MYRINPLQRNVLITADEVNFHAPTKVALDPRMIEHSIIIAEERFIRPALGYEFYYALCDSKNKLVTADNKAAMETAINESLGDDAVPITLNVGDIVNAAEYLNSDNLALWKQFLWKLIAECVMLLAYPEGFVQFGAIGAHLNQPPAGPIPNGTDNVSPDLPSMKWSLNKKLQDRIDPLRESMHQWLCYQKKANSTKYILYKNPCDCNADGIAYKRKTDIILNIYDDEENNNCCDKEWGLYLDDL